MDKLNKIIIENQKIICLKYKSEFVPIQLENFIAVALSSFEKFTMPINGLRHPIQSDNVTNWYLWAGEYSESEDFFQNIHVHHLAEICPKALSYLGLAPGWRFLFDNNYEDVWFDESLMTID